MTAATDAARDGDVCTAPDDVDCSDRDVFPCWPCYRAGQGDMPTESGADAVDDLADLSVGDPALWGDRAVPCTVVDTGSGSHVVVDGPNGATYRIHPIPNGGYRFDNRGGTVDDFRRVDDDDTDTDDHGRRFV